MHPRTISESIKDILSDRYVEVISFAPKSRALNFAAGKQNAWRRAILQ
jgi:hypothetical protein